MKSVESSIIAHVILQKQQQGNRHNMVPFSK